MENSSFESIINSQKDLDLLINEKRFGVMCKVKKTAEMTPEFIDWVSPKYLEAFQHILNRHGAEKPGVVVAVIRMNFLANAETKDKMVEKAQPYIDQMYKDVAVFRELVSVRKFNAETAVKQSNKVFNPIVWGLFQHLKTPAVQAEKKQVGEELLAISDLLKDYKANRHAEQFFVYQTVIQKMNDLKLDGQQQAQVKSHEVNQSNKATIGIIITVIVAILIILKWVWRFSR